MALLTLDERKAIFKELGLGEYNKANILAFQKKYLLRKSDYDGIYGQNTDNALRTVYYTKIYTKNFKPTEFRCECGGKYCCGFPTYMKPAELIHIQKIRDHYGKPITITCGMRDKKYNSTLGGSVQNSLHLKGQALDFYQSGVTDTLANRKKSIKWIKKQANHHYTYGDGINSNGYSVRAPYMGNALHTDTYDNVKPKHPASKGTNTQATAKKPSASVQKPSATTSAKKPTTAKKPTATTKKPAATKKPTTTAKPVTETKGKKIADMAKSFCGELKKENPKYKKAALEVYGKGHDTYCHRFVGTVLKKCGYPKMDYSGKTAVAWKKIMAYLKKNFKEVKGTPQAGDIHVVENSKGAKHIFIELGGGKKAEANSKKKYYPHIAKTSKGKKNWIFRAK